MSNSDEMDPRAPGSMLGAALFACGRFNRDSDRGVPRMSMGTVTKAMAEAARSFGAEIRTGAPVSCVMVEDGAVSGVRLASGEEIRSFIVVSNADPKRTFTTMFEPEDIGRRP
jgi:phytoene dehydrogenase-like protein